VFFVFLVLKHNEMYVLCVSTYTETINKNKLSKKSMPGGPGFVWSPIEWAEGMPSDHEIVGVME